MTTAISSFHEEQSIKFFKEISRHLGMRSRHKLVKLVRAVLSNVRRSLSEDQAALVVSRLPRLFRRLFIGNQKSGEKQLSIKHLDELVDTIYMEDRSSQHHAVFTSEIDTLNAVILVLNKLDRFFGILELRVFRYPLTQELKQAAIEEAV
ncbi:MAG TPA: DUF2267 domain-containing protein [Chryseolinea sp.]|nr:DUF2267 domain-containing protein [Chryseolinea sp.]